MSFGPLSTEKNISDDSDMENSKILSLRFEISNLMDWGGFGVKIWGFLDLSSVTVATCRNLSQLVGTCRNLSELVATRGNLWELVATCLHPPNIVKIIPVART